MYKHLNSITKKIWLWCEKRNIWIFASYIASKVNIEADFESRRKESSSELELSQKAFRKIANTFGNPDINLFASRVNTKCKKFVSWKGDPDSFAIDAFTINWNKYFFYAFPPPSMILKCLQKIRNDKAVGILLVPDWPSQSWYPTFHNMLISEPLEINAKNNIYFSNRKDPFWTNVTLVVGILSGKPSN